MCATPYSTIHRRRRCIASVQAQNILSSSAVMVHIYIGLAVLNETSDLLHSDLENIRVLLQENRIAIMHTMAGANEASRHCDDVLGIQVRIV
eukprot:XP_001707937.1 Hypothetical protein GL50803_31696 [Giardia lamblia ATCC 50803]